MKKMVVTLALVSAMFAISGCTIKTAATKTVKTPVCAGCENLPECVPGPYGDCIKN